MYFLHTLLKLDVSRLGSGSIKKSALLPFGCRSKHCNLPTSDDLTVLLEVVVTRRWQNTAHIAREKAVNSMVCFSPPWWRAHQACPHRSRQQLLMVLCFRQHAFVTWPLLSSYWAIHNTQNHAAVNKEHLHHIYGPIVWQSCITL